jgi:glycerol uptake facilitator-like aquaporin
VPLFVVAQIVGAIAGTAVFGWLYREADAA